MMGMFFFCLSSQNVMERIEGWRRPLRATTDFFLSLAVCHIDRVSAPPEALSSARMWVVAMDGVVDLWILYKVRFVIGR
jgi:hypothetical protein